MNQLDMAGVAQIPWGWLMFIGRLRHLIAVYGISSHLINGAGVEFTPTCFKPSYVVNKVKRKSFGLDIVQIITRPSAALKRLAFIWLIMWFLHLIGKCGWCRGKSDAFHQDPQGMHFGFVEEVADDDLTVFDFGDLSDENLHLS